LENGVKQENLEMMAKQLVRMRRSAHGLLTTLNQLVPVIDIALQRFDPKCRKCFLDVGLLSDCRCTPLKSN
jgi:hypothetical protein